MMHLVFLTGAQIFLALVLLAHSSLPINNRLMILGEEDAATPTVEPTTEPTPETPPPPLSEPTSTPESLPTSPEPVLTPGAEPTETPTPTSAPETTVSLQPSSKLTTPPNAQADHDQIATSIINPGEITTKPEAINAQSVAEAAKEEEKLSQITDPAAQTQMLLDFSKDKVADVDKFLKSDDQTSVSFASQRFDEQISKIGENLNNLSGSSAVTLQKQTADFCRQADLSLKSAQLMVPEEAEQDLEINRARCLNLTE